jgi:hypothetical protein
LSPRSRTCARNNCLNELSHLVFLEILLFKINILNIIAFQQLHHYLVTITCTQDCFNLQITQVKKTNSWSVPSQCFPS